MSATVNMPKVKTTCKVVATFHINKSCLDLEDILASDSMTTIDT